MNDVINVIILYNVINEMILIAQSPKVIQKRVLVLYSSLKY